MTPDPATWKRKAFEAAAVVARWALGAFFIYMGLKKAMHPEEFLKLTRQYEMVHTPFLLNSIAAGLPWFEAFCGALLLLGIAVRGTALTLVAVLVPFTGLVLRRALALQALRAIPFCAVKFDCGCGAGEVYICGKLAENIILILVSCWLLSGAGRAFCARHTLFPVKSGKGWNHDKST
jgi:uncharacterized membrane protein YphA (DoxX/SURF4 family)